MNRRYNLGFLVLTLFILAVTVSSVSAEQRVAGAATGTMNNTMDVLNLIRADHARILTLAYQIEIAQSSNDTRTAQQAFNQLGALTTAHMRAEEQVFYPEIRRVYGKAFFESMEEHNLIRQEAAYLQRTPMENETWDARFSVMGELTKLHMSEEESMIFAIAKINLNQAQRNSLGMRFMQVEGPTGTAGTTGAMVTPIAMNATGAMGPTATTGMTGPMATAPRPTSATTTTGAMPSASPSPKTTGY